MAVMLPIDARQVPLRTSTAAGGAADTKVQDGPKAIELSVFGVEVSRVAARRPERPSP